MQGDINKLIQQICGVYNKDLLSIEIATVQTVDLDEWTCTAIPQSGIAQTLITGIQFSAELSSNGFILVPAIGSNIIVVQTLRNENYVFMCSEVDQFIFYCDNGDGTFQSFVINKNGITLGDGSYGGIPIDGKILSNLGSLLTYMNSQFTAIATALNGLGGGLGAPITEGMANSPTMESTQNKEINHGIPITP